MSNLSMIINLNLSLDKKYSKLSSISIIKRMELICQYIVFQTNSKIMPHLKKILEKVSKLIRMNNSERGKKTNMKKSQELKKHNQHRNNLLLVDLTKLTNLPMKLKILDPTLFS